MLQSSKRLLNKAHSLFRRKLSSGPFGCLDAPKAGGLCPGTFNVVSGWVFDQNGRRITGVEVSLGQKLLGACDYGLEREDVYKAYPHYPQAQGCGYSGWVFIPHTTRKPILVYSIDDKGQRHLLGRRHAARWARAACFFKRNFRLGKGAANQTHRKPCLPLDIPAQILIAGLAKSGTTALFFTISNSLVTCEEAASTTRLLFEPTSYSGSNNERVLAKIIIAEKIPLTLWGENSRARWVTFDDFKKFNKKILLHRDPRDRLISTLLYSTQGPTFRSNTKSLEAFLGLLQKKERVPRSVSVLDLITARLSNGNLSLQTWKSSLANHLNYFLEFRRQQHDFFYYSYEDFVQEKTKALECFLGFPLTGEAVVEKSFNRVVRTKKSGDWQNWFLEEDVCFFKPVFQAFMQELGYEDSWSLPSRQVLLPAHASEYVRKNTRSKKSGA